MIRRFLLALCVTVALCNFADAGQTVRLSAARIAADGAPSLAIELMPGSGSPVHVTAGDQDGNPLLPDLFNVAIPAGLDVGVANDATGFNFTAPANAPASTGVITITYLPNNALTAKLTVTIRKGITAIRLMSP